MRSKLHAGETPALLRVALSAVLLVGALSCGEGGPLDKTAISLPKCVNPTNRCDAPSMFAWRNSDELWAWSATALGIRRDGDWEWKFPCVEGEFLFDVAFRGDELWVVCDGEVRRQVPPAPRPVKLDAPVPAGQGTFVRLDGDFLLLAKDGVYGWNGAQFEKVATAPPPGLSSTGGRLDAIGLNRNALYVDGWYWDGAAWTEVTLAANYRMKSGMGYTRRVNGKICVKGRWALNGAAAMDIVEAIRFNMEAAFIDSHDCSTVLATHTGTASGTLFEAERMGDLEELGQIQLFDSTDWGSLFRVDEDTLIVSSPKNVPGSPAEMYEYELH